MQAVEHATFTMPNEKLGKCTLNFSLTRNCFNFLNGVTLEKQLLIVGGYVYGT